MSDYMPAERNRRIKHAIVVAAGLGVIVVALVGGRSEPTPNGGSATGADVSTSQEPTDEPEAAGNVLVDLAGAGTAISDEFRPESAWTLSWSYDCTLLTNAGAGFLLTIDGSPEEITVVDSVEDQASGVEEYSEQGALRLQMTTECPWTVAVLASISDGTA